MPGGSVFTYYIISAKALRMIEVDNIDLTGGSAYAQSATVPPLSGKFVFQHSGWSSAGRTIAAGQFSSNASGSITAGVSDSIAGGPPTTPSTSKPVTGSYMLSGTQNGTLTLMDAAGSSNFNIYMVDPALNILDPTILAVAAGRCSCTRMPSSTEQELWFPKPSLQLRPSSRTMLSTSRIPSPPLLAPMSRTRSSWSRVTVPQNS